MKKRMKSLSAALLVLAMTLSLAACGASPTAQAETAVEGMFQAVKNLDFEAAAKYTGEELLGDDMGLDELPGGGEEFLKNLFGRVDYQILGSQQEDEDTVFVQTKISALDMKPVFGQFLTKAMEYVFAHMFDDPAPTDEQMEAEMIAIFTGLLDDPELAMLESEVLIEVNKTEDGWQINPTETLKDALLGGLEGAMDELSNAFG